MSIPKLSEALSNARFKIEWAKVHIDYAEGIINEIVAENTSPISILSSTENERVCVLIGPKKEIPVQLLLHIGDAIHALNSSWDYLWSGLARSINPDLSKKITAPRHENRLSLELVIDKAKGFSAEIHRAFPQARSFILDHVKPYNPAEGGSDVWLIGKLDNINKHRFIMVTPYAISFDSDFIIKGGDDSSININKHFALRTQGAPMTMSLVPPITIFGNPNPNVTVIFCEDGLAISRPVIDALTQFVEAATEMCNVFEEIFLQRA